jgi:4-amino-4-deoxy-L-arabinose transferase-like glycosyltransferase
MQISVNVTIKIQTFLKKHKRVILCILCFLAMLRIFFFSAIFPFFNNVDEQAHFDTVVKYSKGHLPHKEKDNYEYETAKFIVLYGSPEYFHSSKNFNFTGIPPPLWTFDREQLSSHKKEQLDKYINKQIGEWTTIKNHEAFSPPLYYTIAGIWYNLLKISGFKGGNLLYGIRFLNVFLYGILFYLAYLICKNTNKNNIAMQFGILLLLTFFPQDVFFSISSDVLSPLLCLLSLYLLIKISKSNRSSLFHLITGIAVSAAFLTKFTNLPILIIFIILIIIRIRKLLNEERLKEQLPKLFLLVFGCLLPIIFWLGWNSFVLGDITGNAAKLRYQGVTVKPLAEIWNHPIFTINGLSIFVIDTIITFWRGEFVWGLQRIASVEADFFYFISSCIFIPVSVISALVLKDDYSPEHRFFNYISILYLFLSILLLVMLSIMFDFGPSVCPSREYPYFSNGRLILGALIPFLILYVDGLRVIVTRISARINPLLIVLLICILIMFSQIYITYPVFISNYNWFHMYQ